MRRTRRGCAIVDNATWIRGRNQMPSTAPVIDVHSHFMPPGYTAQVAAAVERDPPQLTSALTRIRQPAAPMTDLQIRLDEMERSGVTVSVLSLPPPGVTVGDPAARGEMA